MPDIPMPPNPDQGFPPRPTPFWPPGTVTRHMIPMGQPAPNGEPVYAVILDTPDARIVTYWQRSALAGWRDDMTKLLESNPGTGLTIADETDLKALRDASPFEES